MWTSRTWGKWVGKLRKGGPLAKPRLPANSAFKREVRAVKLKAQKKPAAAEGPKRRRTVFTKLRVRDFVTQGVRVSAYSGVAKRRTARRLSA